MKNKMFCVFMASALVSLSACAFCGCDRASGYDGAPRVTVTEDGRSLVEWKDTGANSYNVYRAPSKYGEYTLISSGAEGSYTDEYRFGSYKIGYVGKDGKETLSNSFGEESALLGDNVYVFAPTDNPTTVSNIIKSVCSVQEKAHFGSERYSFLFKPGTYDDRISLDMGYFTTFAGLGGTPDDVSVNTLSSSAAWNNHGGDAGNNALINFWRGAENFSTRSSVLWAVSQGCYLRDVNISGDLKLHDRGGYASGGFMSNCIVSGKVESGSQQQWFTRNTKQNGFTGGVWNMCFAGMAEGSAPRGDWSSGNPYTVVEKVPSVREKPHLVFGADGYSIRVPMLKKDSSGVDGGGAYLIPQSEIFFAEPSDGAGGINEAISLGKHVVLTPGIYELDEPITVTKANTVVLGLGMATLVSKSDAPCLVTSDVDGITVAGILFDAGDKSDCLMRAGDAESDVSHADDPMLIADCFFRVGGAVTADTQTGTCLEVYSDDTVIDNIWLWRADHGDGVGWRNNAADYGLVVYGDGVKAYGLFSEHFKKNNVLWRGNGGTVIFFQSEVAYDVPNQESWTQSDGTLGYESFKVLDSADTFTAYGLGVYANFHNDGVILQNGISVPDKSGVTVTNACTVKLSAKGEISNVINGAGGKTEGIVVPQRVVLFVGGDGNE